MFHQILRAGIAAGLIAGIAVTGLQSGIVTPLIEAAETYETGAGDPGLLAHPHGELTHTHAFGNSAHEHDGHAVIFANGERDQVPAAVLVDGERDYGPATTLAGGAYQSARTGASDGAHDPARAAALPNDAHDRGHAAADHHHGGAWAPEGAVGRIAWTAVSNVATAIGFALLLGAVFAWRGGTTWRQGLIWGAAGFVVFFANPAIGLYPEIPGAFTAELHDRQLWWLFTVLCSGIGVGLLLLAPKVAAKGVGAVLLVVPHVAGAPHPDMTGGLAPQALADQFVIATAVTNGVFWLILGLAVAFAFSRFVRR